MQAAEVVAGRVGPAGPLLGGEVRLEVDERLEHLVTQVVGHGAQDRGAALLGGLAQEVVGGLVGDEGDQGAARVRVVGVVVDLLAQLLGAEAGAGKALVPPERALVHRVDLDDQAHRGVLVHLLLQPRERGLEGDARVQVGRYGHDHVSGPYGDAVGPDGGRARGLRTVRGGLVVAPTDGPDRALEEDRALLEGVGHRLRDRLHAPDDAAVEDEVLIYEVGEGAGRGGHENGLQHRERVGGLGQHAPGHEDADVLPGGLVVGLAAQPLGEGEGVQFAGARVLPGALDADVGDQLVQGRDDALHLRLGRLSGREHVSGVLVAGAVRGEVDAGSLAVARVGAHAQLVEQAEEFGLVGRDPLSADLQEGAVDLPGPGATAHAVAGLQDGDGPPGGLEGAGGHQPGGAGAHDHDIAVERLGAADDVCATHGCAPSNIKMNSIH